LYLVISRFTIYALLPTAFGGNPSVAEVFFLFFNREVPQHTLQLILLF